jgi:PAS domain S-box-containing protein
MTELGEQILGPDGTGVVELLETLGEAITIRDPYDRIVYANRAALAQMGFDTLEELLSRPLGSIMDEYVVRDDQGRPLEMSDVPSVRLMKGEPVEPLLMHTIKRDTGESHWQLLKAAALRDPEGNMLAAITVIEDVTAVKTAEVYTSVLAESGRILASSLDYEQTLRNVAEAAVPAVADWCVVDLIDEDLRRQHVVTAHRDPAMRELAKRARQFEPEVLDREQRLAQVYLTGISELYAHITDEQLVAGARDAEHLDLLRTLGMRSAALVPMRVAARTIGVMTFVTSDSLRGLTASDLSLAEQLGRRAAVAVENSRLHTRLADVAETLQQSLLPTELPPVPGWEVASLYNPAETGQRIEVGGDFYEIFECGTASLLIIGDVTGKGVRAATLTALMRYGARFASRLEPEPAAILRRLDEELRRRASDELCTAVCAMLHDERIVISSAGHPATLLARPGGEVVELPANGPILGAFADGEWRDDDIPVAAGELLLLYTDGVTETRGKHERFGTARLHQLLSENAGASPAEVLAHLESALGEFGDGTRWDDVAALAMRPVAGEQRSD